MRRHSIDLVGLLFGTAFTIAGAGLLVRETTGTAVNPTWIAGLGLMLLGAIALVATITRGPSRDRQPDHDHDHDHSAVDEPDVSATVTSDE